MMLRKVTLGSFLFLLVIGLTSLSAAAADIKIGTISLQQIVLSSKAGSEAQKTLEKKANEFKEKLQKEGENLEGLRQEIEKKSSVWSGDVKEEKERDYQKQLRAFQIKQEDAQYELKQLEAKVMGPILQDLHEAIKMVGKENGYTIILENSRKGIQSQVGLMYADDSLDISNLVLEELNKRAAKKEAAKENGTESGK